MPRLILFDIDGTLVDTGGAGRRAFLAAFRACYGRDVEDFPLDFAGKTDIGILRTLMERAGLPFPDARARSPILARYLEFLDAELRDGSGRPCPGVPDLLAALARRDDVRLGLLTGNIEEGARRKLAPFDLARYFAFGAFGSDDEDRDRLVPIARSRAQAIDPAVSPDDPVVLVGDTPLDIRCARAGEATILAVATGIFDEASLRALDPDVLLPDLADTARVIEALLRLTTGPPPGRATPRTGR